MNEPIDEAARADDLSEKLQAAGEHLQDDVVARIEAATKPIAHDEELDPVEQRLQIVTSRYRLDAHKRDDLERLLAAHHAIQVEGAFPDAHQARRLRHTLVHEEVTVGAYEVLLGGDAEASEIDALRSLATTLLVGASGPAAAGAAVLLGRCAEHDGDHQSMETHIEAALAAEPRYWPALVDAAWFAEDRGDATRASSLLTETKMPAFAGEIARLGRFVRSGDHKVGRNDSCPCGSGRKFKACCLNRGGFSLADRAGWLTDKVQGFLARIPQREVLDRVASAAVGEPIQPLPAAYQAAIQAHPMIVELCLFEGGVLRRFLDQRGHLLPTDEREMAESWLLAPLGVWTFVGTDPSDGANGNGPGDRTDAVLIEKGSDRVRIPRARQLLEIDPGTFLLARPVLVPGLGHRLLVTAPLPPEVVSRVTEALAEEPVSVTELASLVGVAGRIPPATIDDLPFVLCVTIFSLPEGTDHQRIADSLNRELLDVDGRGEWIEPEDAPDIDRDPEWIADGSVVLLDEQILMRAGTEERADRLTAIVERLVPEVERVSEQRRSRDEVIAELLDLPTPTHTKLARSRTEKGK